MQRPNFFLVGAPKCGTTALGDYLRRHPEIYMGESKEPHFFGSDLAFAFPRPTLSEYLACFAAASPRKRVGEGSVWYLASRCAASEIRDFAPDARIIIMLRNPVEMVYSLHAQRVYNGNEDLRDFAEALAAEEDRRVGRRLPRRASDRMGMFYRDAGRFTDQVARYMDVFGRERVHVISFDDFAAHTADIYAETCRFLGVGDRFRPDFPVVNMRKTVRSELLRDLLHRPPFPVAVLFGVLGLRATRSGSYKGWLKRLNSRKDSRGSMAPTLRATLQREFAPEMERLSKLLGRDFTHWCRG